MLIEVKNLSVDFMMGKELLHAVKDVSFSLKEGEIVGVVGESGSGKSVTVTALLGLLGPTAKVKGTILVNNENIFECKSQQLQSIRKNFFGAIFQEPGRSFDPIYTIEKTFLETFRATSPAISKKEAFDKAVALLEEVAISNADKRLKNYPHQFSGGMLQRIMIALALANNPKVLIADEPTTALDVTIQAQIISLLKTLQKKRNLSIIFITHDLPLVSQISHRLLVMYGGTILEEGPTKQIISSPKSPYSFALLHALPRLMSHYKSEKLFTIGGAICNPFDDIKGCAFAPRCEFATTLCFNNKGKRLSYNDRAVCCHFPLSDSNRSLLGAL